MKALTDHDRRTPFEKFKELTQKVIAISKKEIAERQAQYERKTHKRIKSLGRSSLF